MAIAAARVYSEGHRLRHLRLHEEEDRKVQEGQFAWIGLVDPTVAELEMLQQRFGLHPLGVEDALCDHPLPKVSIYGDQIFVVTRTARLVDEEVVYGETCAFLCKNHIITIRKGSDRAHTEGAPSPGRRAGDDEPWHRLCAVFDPRLHRGRLPAHRRRDRGRRAGHRAAGAGQLP